MIYECGEKPIGPAWFNFNPRFYIIALVFVIFEVEIAFMFPVASVFKCVRGQAARACSRWWRSSSSSPSWWSASSTSG